MIKDEFFAIFKKENMFFAPADRIWGSESEYFLTHCEGSDALLVGAEGLGDGAHGPAVVSVLHVTQALLRLGELLQAVQPEVEVLRGHTGPQTLVELAGELVASLQRNENISSGERRFWLHYVCGFFTVFNSNK